MYVEILSCILSDRLINGNTDFPSRKSCFDFESVTLNLNNVEAIKLRKSRAGRSLCQDYFSAIEYHYCNKTYYELFKSDNLALSRYKEIKRMLGGGEYNRRIVDLDKFLLPMDASHENEPFRTYLRLFCGTNVNELDKIIEDYNQRILNGNIKEEETISEWLNNFLDKRRKMKEAEQENEVKKVVTLL